MLRRANIIASVCRPGKTRKYSNLRSLTAVNSQHVPAETEKIISIDSRLNNKLQKSQVGASAFSNKDLSEMNDALRLESWRNSVDKFNS